MTKAELVNQISDKTGIEKNITLEVVEAAMKVIKTTMSGGENVYLRGFGSFIVKRRAKKIGRIISKNTTIVIPAHNIPAFRPAKVFANKVKNAKIKAKQKSESVD
jgi:DNA-binding protein HU-beta